MVHKFNDSLKYGESIENLLDDYFMRWFNIEEVSPGLQRLGVDRIFTKLSTGERFGVEYKADRRAEETGNVYIETVSVRKDGDATVKLGWALTSIAQRCLYFVAGPQRHVYILDMNDIRDMLPKWEKTCKKVEVDNGSYVGEGLLVPLPEIETLARGRRVVSD